MNDERKISQHDIKVTTAEGISMKDDSITVDTDIAFGAIKYFEDNCTCQSDEAKKKLDSAYRIFRTIVLRCLNDGIFWTSPDEEPKQEPTLDEDVEEVIKSIEDYLPLNDFDNEMDIIRETIAYLEAKNAVPDDVWEAISWKATAPCPNCDQIWHAEEEEKIVEWLNQQKPKS